MEEMQEPSTEPPKEAITLPATLAPTIIDYSLRWASLYLLKQGWLPEFLFWLTQIAIISVVVFFTMIDRAETVTKRLGVEAKTSVNPLYSTRTISLLWGIILSGCYITFTLVRGRIGGGWVDTLVTSGVVLATFICYGFYTWIIYELSVTDRQEAPEQPTVSHPIETPADTDIEGIDRNDNQIIEMQAELASIAQRVDTYTLESALFGALAFSGFLDLIASDKPVLKSIHGLFAICRDATSLLLSFAFQDTGTLLSSKFDQDTVIAAVTLETLLCSILFVSVIISRIRLSDVLKHADYAVRIASAYNEKEEEIYNLMLQDAGNKAVERRLNSLAHRISEALKTAEPLFKELWAISGYMRFFRNFGVFSFVLILITSAFLASLGLGLAFAGVSLLAYTYTTVDEFLRRKRLEAIKLLQRSGKLLLRR